MLSMVGSFLCVLRPENLYKSREPSATINLFIRKFVKSGLQ
jgi:hypothetical protein